jgi:hypothetical protein
MRNVLGIVVIAGAIAVGTMPAMASPLEGTLHGQSIASQSQCPTGTVVINISEKVVNDADSAVGGGYWALDDFVRQIQVVQVSATTFCATVNYTGTFTTFEGPSPQGTGTVGEGIVGHFDGGYVSTLFTGTLDPNPMIFGSPLRTKGSIGTFDYGCGQSGTCPGSFNWVDAYFISPSGFDLANWGWTYHTAQNGTWVNAASGNSGDITGN